MPQPDKTADIGNPISDLPYAIRVYAQARKISIDLHKAEEAVEREEQSILRRMHPDDPVRGVVIHDMGRRRKDRRNIKEFSQLTVEAAVEKLAEKLLPSVVSKLLSDVTPTFMVKTAFTIAQAFIDERDDRALAIRTANVDSLLDPHNNQPKGE